MTNHTQFTVQFEKKVSEALGYLEGQSSDLVKKLVDDFLNMESPDLLYYYKSELNFDSEDEWLDTLDLGCGLDGGEQLEKIIHKFKNNESVKIRSFCVDSKVYESTSGKFNDGMLIRSNASIREYLNNCSEKFDLIYSRNALDLLELDSEAQVKIVDTYRRISELLKPNGVAMLITKSKYHFRNGMGTEWFYLDEKSRFNIEKIQIGEVKFYKHGFYDICIMIK